MESSRRGLLKALALAPVAPRALAGALANPAPAPELKFRYHSIHFGTTITLSAAAIAWLGQAALPYEKHFEFWERSHGADRYYRFLRDRYLRGHRS